jgi:hypothetical protein
MTEIKMNCDTCGKTHVIKLADEEEQRLRSAGNVVIACPDLDRRYRLVNFFVETRRGIFEHPAAEKLAKDQSEYLQHDFGTLDFGEKFARWKGIKYPPIGLIDEYPEKITQIVNTYSMGYAYPAVTSACCLSERILNRLVLRCRDHFKGHPDYKRIYRKDSFDDWALMLDLIEKWSLISPRAIQLFRELMPIRHQTIHYNDGYDFGAVVETVINKLIEAITEVFGVMNRKDIYWVFDVPGEVWVRSEAQSLPFVKEFVLPHCYFAHAQHEIDLPNGRIIERVGRTGRLTDAEFIDLRKASGG